MENKQQSNNKNNTVVIQQPDWLSKVKPVDPTTDPYLQVEFVLKLVKKNIQYKTGGPFAAAIFDDLDGSLISFAVNTVTLNHCSMAHAEMLATSLAQQSLKQYSLAAQPGKHYRLVSSAEPCAMCTSAINWSGISHLVYSASSTVVESIGFDEGYKPDNWQSLLNAKGVAVTPDIAASEGEAILKEYQKNDGFIYNG